jgi:hypothetical protein
LKVAAPFAEPGAHVIVVLSVNLSGVAEPGGETSDGRLMAQSTADVSALPISPLDVMGLNHGVAG